MKTVLQKSYGNNLIVLDHEDYDRLPQVFVAEVKPARNPLFHRKVFQFFRFCFEHWKSDREFMDEPGQFEVFRKHLTCLAGYYDSYYSIKGETRIEAQSLAYENMDDEEFRRCYSSLIDAAIKHIFVDCDEKTEHKLRSFF